MAEVVRRPEGHAAARQAFAMLVRIESAPLEANRRAWGSRSSRGGSVVRSPRQARPGDRPRARGPSWRQPRAGERELRLVVVTAVTVSMLETRAPDQSSPRSASRCLAGAASTRLPRAPRSVGSGSANSSRGSRTRSLSRTGLARSRRSRTRKRRASPPCELSPAFSRRHADGRPHLRSPAARSDLPGARPRELQRSD